MSKTLGVNTKIFINKDRFISFVFSKKHSNVAKIAAEMGYGYTYIMQHINSGAFSIKMLFTIKTRVGIEFKDMDFIDDPAYKIVAQLYGHPDEAGGTTFGKLIEEVRGYFASGLDADKIRDILIEKKAKGKTVKASSSESLPMAAITQSTVSEAFDNVANDSQKTLGQITAECAEELSANIDAQTPRYLKGYQDVPYADLYDDDGEETHDSDVDDRDQIIEDLQATLKEREGWIADLRVDLSLRDKWLAHQKSDLAKKDKEIEELKSKLSAEIPPRRKPIMIDFNISVRERADDGTTHILPSYLVSCRSRHYVKKPELDRPLVYTTELSERVDSPNEVETAISAFVSMGIEKIYKEEETTDD